MMAFGVFHLATLFAVTAMVVGFSGLVLVLMLAPDHNQSSVAPMIWGAAMAVGAIGIVCLSLEPRFGRIAEASGNALILFGTALSWTAARVFDGRPVVPYLVVVGPMASLLWTIVPVQPGSRVSLILTLIVGSTYTIATATELWYGRDENLPSRTAAIALLLLHAGVYLGRAISEGFRPPAGWRHENDIAGALIIEALLHTIVMAFLLMGLTKERAESRSSIRLQDHTSIDGLTGLGNRRAFDVVLDHEFRHAIRDRTPLGLLMIDVNNLKTYNEMYGYQRGDEYLRAIATAIRSSARRPGDVGLRYGGDEFAMLLPRTDEAGTAHVARTVLANVMAIELEHPGGSGETPAVSIGGAVIAPGPGSSSPGALSHAAELALYRAKIAGRNRIRMTDVQAAGAG